MPPLLIVRLSPINAKCDLDAVYSSTFLNFFFFCTRNPPRAPDQLAAILERNIFHLLSSEETVGELLSNAL